ncbi:uncharacterized protein BDZ83DRAFT_656863 [Colletotrichum acutatum]|uniref:Uncharacterized protein n=1 Tax=Glomerella acutata TaxID=27357 RepID=A0AAD8U7V6_GLOAC|nr:uncharacterized protein BDZ83DRAFT_656863 [Colletotrichum acutatum]KAK1711264.1 hypothetical protein BDZ83DRAFT_656863 [Colletotrichum acutatum]
MAGRHFLHVGHIAFNPPAFLLAEDQAKSSRFDACDSYLWYTSTDAATDRDGDEYCAPLPEILGRRPPANRYLLQWSTIHTSASIWHVCCDPLSKGNEFLPVFWMFVMHFEPVLTCGAHMCPDTLVRMSYRTSVPMNYLKKVIMGCLGPSRYLSPGIILLCA